VIIHSVSEVTSHLKALLESDALLTDVWVQGEVSNFTPAASGHWYWTLKDESAALQCVMWRSRVSAQTYTPEVGESLLAHGYVSVYETAGKVQLYADHVEPAGRGDLYRRFEELKARLAAEGLFDEERKRPLPRFPRRIGVVTSLDAAALRDVCRVLARRWPSVEVLVSPTLVQGDAAPAEIVAAIEAIQRSDVDVVIVTRGGGSLEDLWAFNDEGVARAVAGCAVPVISGVGHETDFTICDFANFRYQHFELFA
jgi:exodeoxyribonuclease VII large subunit